ncbi:MAG: hypothetical protein IPP82_09740 [Xanthomonadales bacterium]|nr:hypothetical protein [Xanthomonadales bacterium]
MRPILVMATTGIALCIGASHALAAGQVARDQLLAQAPDSTRALSLNVHRDGDSDIALEIQPMQVFTQDAELIIVGADGKQEHAALPNTRYFRVQGTQMNGILAIPDNGEEFGLIQDNAGFQQLKFGGDGSLRLHAIDTSSGAARSFQCENDQSIGDMERSQASNADEPRVAPSSALAAPYTARIAIETDNEYLARFSGNTITATNYVGSLIGFISTIYDAEVQTNMQVSFLRLWASPDPFVQTKPACLMLESGKYWNDNQAATSRTTMHFLSGKTTTAGIAWIGVLCSGPFTATLVQVGETTTTCPGLSDSANYGGGYGTTEGISGNFNAANPSVIWDVDSVAHEIGHNFNSPHTHCYNNIGGNASPIDQCSNSGNGCYAGATSLPGPQGVGSGTIMSYCHLLPGGFSNTTLTFGTGHPYGVAPERVPSRMFAHVQQRASSSPSCLARINVDLIFKNGFD